MSKPGAELPIFTKTYDFLTWLVPATQHFPRLYRHTVTGRLLDAALNFQELLVEANSRRHQARLECLHCADAQLGKVRLYLRLSHHWRWMNAGQYEHVSRMVAELGQLLGGWQRTTRQQAASEAVSAGPAEASRGAWGLVQQQP